MPPGAPGEVVVVAAPVEVVAPPPPEAPPPAPVVEVPPPVVGGGDVPTVGDGVVGGTSGGADVGLGPWAQVPRLDFS